MSPLGEAKARSSVEINDSCNYCCCCWPRKIKSSPHLRPERENSTIVPGSITRTHTVSMPILKDDGSWEVEIDGVRHGLQANPVQQSIIEEHGGK